MDKIDERLLREKIKNRQYARDHRHRVFYKRGEYAYYKWIGLKSPRKHRFILVVFMGML